MFQEMFKDQEPDVALKPGEILFLENAEADKAYVVHSGHIELRVRGNELTTITPTDIFGEMALVDDRPRFAMAVAGPQGAKLYSIDKDQFTELVRQNPEFSLRVMRVMAERLRKWGELFD